MIATQLDTYRPRWPNATHTSNQTQERHQMKALTKAQIIALIRKAELAAYRNGK